VGRGYAASIAVLAAVWGASYLFIRVGIRDFAPTVLMELRMLVAFVPLFAFLAHQSGGVRAAVRDVRSCARDGLVLGVINNAFPFTLIAWGEKHVDSGVAAIANSTVPIFVALLALRFKPSERATGLRLLGIGVGLVGVGVLAGVHPKGGWWAVAGTLAVVVASLSYAAGGLYGQSSAGRASAPVLATASTFYGALVLLPFALAQLPDRAPGWKSTLSVLGLSVLGTALAQLVLFRLLREHGASRTTLVTYLLPPVALFYGALILNEEITGPAVAGMALILAGVALGSGVIRERWRRAAPAPIP